MHSQKSLKLQKAGNLAQTTLIFLLMGGLPAAIGWTIGGTIGALWALALGISLVFVTPKISPRLILKMYQARPLAVAEARGLYAIVHDLAKRAGLPHPPVLYYIPSRMMNAFSVGNADNSAIAVTDGLARNLEWNEITGVLAHEISHISHGDLRIMSLADGLTRFTNALSALGLAVLLFSLPLYLFAKVLIPLPALLLLLAAPTISVLLQLALSRTREFDADLGAVALTGDPASLAAALKKLERYPLKIWDVLFMPGRRVPAPSVLRTHPMTEKRITRLLELASKTDVAASHPELRGGYDGGCLLPGDCPEVTRKPRWNLKGIWH